MSSAVPLIPAASAPLLARPHLAGDAPSPLAGVLAHVPELLEAVMPFIAAVYGPSALPERLKEIVVLRTSARNGCRYCTRVHGELARAAGVSDGEIGALRALGQAPATFTPAEAAALGFADAMTDRPAGAVALLEPHFRPHQIVELTVLAGATIFLNRFCTAMGLA